MSFWIRNNARAAFSEKVNAASKVGGKVPLSKIFFRKSILKLYGKIIHYWIISGPWNVMTTVTRTTDSV